MKSTSRIFFFSSTKTIIFASEICRIITLQYELRMRIRVYQFPHSGITVWVIARIRCIKKVEIHHCGDYRADIQECLMWWKKKQLCSKEQRHKVEEESVIWMVLFRLSDVSKLCTLFIDVGWRQCDNVNKWMCSAFVLKLVDIVRTSSDEQNSIGDFPTFASFPSRLSLRLCQLWTTWSDVIFHSVRVLVAQGRFKDSCHWILFIPAHMCYICIFIYIRHMYFIKEYTNYEVVPWKDFGFTPQKLLH